jgi:hypothetical protein
VPVATDPDEPEDGDEVELTPAQREALRKSMESLRKLVLPKIDLPRFVLPHSTFKSFVAISGIAERQQAILRNAMKPLLDSKAGWQKQVSIINSDIFKSSALAQSNTTPWRAGCTRTSTSDLATLSPRSLSRWPQGSLPLHAR